MNKKNNGQKTHSKAYKGAWVVSVFAALLIIIALFGVLSNGFKNWDKINNLVPKDTITEEVNEEVKEDVKEEANELFAIGDTFDGVHFNTSVDPDFSKLDWNNADLVANADSHPDVFSDTDDLRLIVLFSSFLSPKSIEEFLSLSVTGSELFLIHVIRYKVDENMLYEFILNDNIVWTSNDDGGGGFKFGWKFFVIERIANAPFDGTVAYLNDQQDIWGDWVSKSSFVI